MTIHIINTDCLPNSVLWVGVEELVLTDGPIWLNIRLVNPN